MIISAIADKHTERKVNATLRKIAKATGRDMRNMMRMAGIWATQSLSKDTPPGKRRNVNDLAQKYKYRPIRKIPESEGYWYVWGKKGMVGMAGVKGRFFKSTKDLEISKKTGKRKLRSNLVRVRFGFVYWSRNKNKMSYLPYWDGTDAKPKKYAKGMKAGRIPSAGAAKYGWLRAHGILKGTMPEKGNVKKASQASAVYKQPNSLTIINRVKYVDKIAPGTVRKALTLTERRLDGYYRKVIAPKYKRRFG